MSDARMSNSDVLASRPMNTARVWLWVIGSACALVALILGIMAGVEFGRDGLYDEPDEVKGYVLILTCTLASLGALLAWVGALVSQAITWTPAPRAE